MGTKIQQVNKKQVKHLGQLFIVRDFIGNVKEIIHERRCPICGEWYHYDLKKGRSFHCGNSACEDFYNRYLVHLARYKVDEDYMIENELKKRNIDPKNFGRYKKYKELIVTH